MTFKEPMEKSTTPVIIPIGVVDPSSIAPVTLFEFTQIDGFLDLEQACDELVNVALAMKRTHNLESASRDHISTVLVYNIRRRSIESLLNLIGQYVDQIPE